MFGKFKGGLCIEYICSSQCLHTQRLLADLFGPVKALVLLRVGQRAVYQQPPPSNICFYLCLYLPVHWTDKPRSLGHILQGPFPPLEFCLTRLFYLSVTGLRRRDVTVVGDF